MPQKKITFKPGVNQENTRYVTEGGWYDCDKVRFRQGYPEKIGGWVPVSENTFLGVCRSLWNWITLAGANLIGVGTNLFFYIYEGGAYYDVTPLQYSTAGKISVPANAFTTANGSQDVTIAMPGLGTTYNLYVNDYVNIYNVASAINGIPAASFNAQFSVVAVNYTGTPTITITLPSAATSGGSGGSACSIQYYAFWFKLTSVQSFANSHTILVTCTQQQIINNTVYLRQPNGAYITIGGITLGDQYQVFAVGPGTFSIYSSVAAVSDQTLTSALYSQFELNSSPAYVIPKQGWDAGYWGNGTWGNTSDPLSTSIGLWSQANFGENLIFGQRGGAMYIWKASGGVSKDAVSLSSEYNASDVPIVQNNIVVSDASRFVLALGCNDYGSTTLSPMLIRWSDQGDSINWSPAINNQAGSVLLSHGSTIVGFIQARQEIVVFTDSSVYSLQYLGPPAVWGAQLVGTNTSILGPNAMAFASGVVYWMGNGKFYAYNGTVQTLNCDLREYIFSNINSSQNYQIYAGTNEAFNEVWWFYCSANVFLEPDTYIIYNYIDNAWYFGYMSRTAWIDTGLTVYPVAAYPYTYQDSGNIINPVGRLLFHENGTDDNVGATPLAMTSYIQSSEFDIEDGDRFSFVWQLLPDVRFNGSYANNPTVTMTLVGMQNSGSGLNDQENLSAGGQNTNVVEQTEAPVPATYRSNQIVIEKFTGTVPCRVRGRQLIFRIESSGQLGVQWQLGAPRINIRPDGRRGNT
jgi:hypothetical protein